MVKKDKLTKQEIREKFDKLFKDKVNEQCFQCEKRSKNWAEIKHGIFICPGCTKIYKQISKSIQIKSTDLDPWKEQEIKLFEVGGNKKFKQYLQFYQFNLNQPKIFLISQAVQYYRRSLYAQVNNQQIGQKPNLQDGKQPHVFQIPIQEMTADQVFTEAKERLSLAGSKTKNFGKKAFTKVSNKITSGELKQDMKSAANTVSKGVKNFWAFLTSSKQEEKNENQSQNTKI